MIEGAEQQWSIVKCPRCYFAVVQHVLPVVVTPRIYWCPECGSIITPHSDGSVGVRTPKMIDVMEGKM